MKNRLFLLCGAAMALAALTIPASASSEDGVMTPATVMSDLDGATALPGLDATIIHLGYASPSSPDSLIQIAPAVMRLVIHDSGERARSALADQPLADLYEGREVPTAEGVPKST